MKTKKFQELKKELKYFYGDVLDEKAAKFDKICEAQMNERISDKDSSYKQKGMQYRIIAEMCEPIIFKNTSFYYELSSFTALCEGHGESSGNHPGGWLYRKNKHYFSDDAPEVFKRAEALSEIPVFTFCGVYGDERQHFVFNIEPVLENGLCGVYEKIQKELAKPCTEEEKQYLENTCEGLLALKRIGERFSDVAESMKKLTSDTEEIKRLDIISDAAKRVPWNAPSNFFEALNTIAFMKNAIGALEGVGIEGMGRLDVLLYPFYKKDLEEKKYTNNEIYDLICEFLLIWDCHINHDIKMDEDNVQDPAFVYTLGGCDKDGNPVYNELTKMFLQADSELKVVFPKIKCRFGKNSPKEYLDAINSEILNGSSTTMYQNDDITIPALQKIGIELEDARNYSVLGCWEIVIGGATNEHCSYCNLLKVFEYSVYGDFDNPYMKIESIENANSFEEVYDITLSNIKALLAQRCFVAANGRKIWSKVDPLMLISSTLENCVESRKDYTAGGAKYNIDEIICTGAVNVMDSLLAIKELCFEQKKYTLRELLKAVQANWNGYDEIRESALACSFWGDEKEASCKLAARFHQDLFDLLDGMPAPWGGKITLGNAIYMEMPRWARKIRATPDGRKNADYFARGFAPSHLRHPESCTSVMNCLREINNINFAANSVVNIILPKMDKEICEAYVRVAAESVYALQLNCVTKEELLDAQIHPEKYYHIVVRVCGYSARFVSLSKEVQEEFLKRNFYGQV